MTYLLLYFLLQGAQGPPGGVGPMGSVGEKVKGIKWHMVLCLFSETVATYNQIAQPPPPAVYEFHRTCFLCESVF